MCSQPTEEIIRGRIGQRKSERPSQNVRRSLVPLHGIRQPAALTPGDRDGTQLPQEGIDHINGQLLRVTTWLGPDYDTDREWL